jgi:hypothetical protein
MHAQRLSLHAVGPVVEDNVNTVGETYSFFWSDLAFSAVSSLPTDHHQFHYRSKFTLAVDERICATVQNDSKHKEAESFLPARR